jgi:hypothetical protein
MYLAKKAKHRHHALHISTVTLTERIRTFCDKRTRIPWNGKKLGTLLYTEIKADCLIEFIIEAQQNIEVLIYSYL